MMKVLLKDYSKIYQINGKNLRGGMIHELSDAEIKKHKDIIMTEIKEEKPKKSEKKYAEKELYDKTKDQQLKIIDKLGIEPSKKNNNLRYEKDRVKAIMEAQND